MPELRTILASHRDPRVRAGAYRLLAGVSGAGDEVAQLALEGLADRSSRVRDAALSGLHSLRPRGAGAAQALEQHVLRGAPCSLPFHALMVLGAEAVEPLLRLLSHTSPEVRTWAAWTLGRLRGDAAPAVPALIRALIEDSDQITRWNAAEALGNIGRAAKSALPQLQRLGASDDPILRRYVTGAIRTLGR